MISVYDPVKKEVVFNTKSQDRADKLVKLEPNLVQGKMCDHMTALALCNKQH